MVSLHGRTLCKCRSNIIFYIKYSTIVNKISIHFDTDSDKKHNSSRWTSADHSQSLRR